jgi:pyruvate dehydrogenase E2 component (dihydrolipoamide acetyltransferase)
VGIPFFEVTPLPDYEIQGPVEKEPIRSLRKKTAIKTTSSMIQIPHVAHMDECDITELENLRKAHNEKNESKEKLTLLGFIIRAVASLLQKYPAFNSSVDSEKMEIIYKHFYHVGFAADTPKGLMVPVVKNADKKDVIHIAKEVRTLAKKGRDGSITLPEISHGTFTITNVGTIGGTGVVPIINIPEAAILGMGRVARKPVVRDDEIVIRKMLPITLCM